MFCVSVTWPGLIVDTVTIQLSATDNWGHTNTHNQINERIREDVLMRTQQEQHSSQHTTAPHTQLSTAVQKRRLCGDKPSGVARNQLQRIRQSAHPSK